METSEPDPPGLKGGRARGSGMGLVRPRTPTLEGLKVSPSRTAKLAVWSLESEETPACSDSEVMGLDATLDSDLELDSLWR